MHENFVITNHNNNKQNMIELSIEDGQIRKVEYSKGREYHREDGPALTRYHENGNVAGEYYFQNGKAHREDGPAQIIYYKKNKKQKDN